MISSRCARTSVFASPNHAQRLGTKPNHISRHARVHDTLASIPRVCLSTDRRTEIRGWLIHIARHKSRWHLRCLRRFVRPGASDAKCPSGPSESEKARVRVFLLGLFCSGSMFKVCGDVRLLGHPERTLKLHSEGFCREWEPPDARTPDLLRY